jgi:hypothetical protein
MLIQLTIGLIFGGLVGYGVGHMAGGYAEARGVDELPLSAEIAGLVAVIYILIATIVLTGALSPKLGAKLLNVEDADEVREMQAQFVSSGLAMLLWGFALLGLVLAAPVGPLDPAVALAIGAGGLLSGTWFAVRSYRQADELMLAMNLEAGALTYGLVLLVVGGWAMGAHLGYVTAPQPLDLLTLFYVLVLLATFIVVGRRGMLMPR